MFSNNDKISARQIKRLLIFDLFGSASLILPARLAKAGTGIGLWSLLGGIAMAYLYLWLLHSCLDGAAPDYMSYLKQGWGSFLARVFYACYALASIGACAWAANLLAELICGNLLENREFFVALLIILLLALYGGLAGLEARARIYEILFWVLIIPLAVMLLLCIRQVQASQWFPLFGQADGNGPVLFWSGAWRSFTAFLPLTFLLFLIPHVQDRKKMERSAYSALAWSAASLVVIYLILLGVFGSAALAQEEYPIITLLGMVKIPGDFVKRLDAVMIGVWFFTLYALIGTTLYQGVTILRNAFFGVVPEDRGNLEKTGAGTKTGPAQQAENTKSMECTRGIESKIGMESAESYEGMQISSQIGNSVEGSSNTQTENNMQKKGKSSGAVWFFGIAAVVYGLSCCFHMFPQAERLAGRLFYLAGIPFLILLPAASAVVCHAGAAAGIKKQVGKAKKP